VAAGSRPDGETPGWRGEIRTRSAARLFANCRGGLRSSASPSIPAWTRARASTSRLGALQAPPGGCRPTCPCLLGDSGACGLAPAGAWIDEQHGPSWWIGGMPATARQLLVRAAHRRVDSMTPGVPVNANGSIEDGQSRPSMHARRGGGRSGGHVPAERGDRARSGLEDGGRVPTVGACRGSDRERLGRRAGWSASRSHARGSRPAHTPWRVSGLPPATRWFPPMRGPRSGG
jgi:hypothetical protein